jgi:hypothetical protein
MGLSVNHACAPAIFREDLGLLRLGELAVLGEEPEAKVIQLRLSCQQRLEVCWRVSHTHFFRVITQATDLG